MTDINETAMNVKCGVVGCGVIANESYLPAIKKYGRLVAVCDIVEKKAERAAKLWGAEEYYDDYEEMLEKSDVEAVFILTGMGDHAGQAAMAANAGKHVLVQKPLATNMDDLRKAVDAVKKSGVKALIEPCVQMFPEYVKAKEALKEIGTIFWFRAGLGRGPPIWGAATFFTKKAGGPLFDLGVYQISALTFLLGPVERVSGLARTSIPEVDIVPDDWFIEYLSKSDTYKSVWPLLGRAPRTQKIKVEAEDNTLTIMEMKSGCLGIVIANFVTPDGLRSDIGMFPDIEVYGSDGGMLIGSGAYAVAYKTIKMREWVKVGWDTISRRGWSYYEASTKHFLECIVEDKEPIPNIDWGAHVSEIMIKSIESSRTGKTLRMETTFKPY
ncbi:Gfo/Idh/MocA family oxidoreductase [Candidatus Bathyarchaeota archaeon]|nr:Gfo/Idh/MocA family oxidoreductase [Candidatus Bathyarchaeota archaeon]MBS7618328.1 Gfo/Idh/MocA family oxidoreductase [Candidatus Bathyarchaeota archaeon]